MSVERGIETNTKGDPNKGIFIPNLKTTHTSREYSTKTLTMNNAGISTTINTIIKRKTDMIHTGDPTSEPTTVYLI